MNSIDVKILTLLQDNARISLKDMASAVYLSSPAVAARLERLQRDKIISGYTAKINQKKLGFGITAFIFLDLRPAQKPFFYPFICEHPNVLECNCITGRFSILIKVTFKSTEELDVFVGQLQEYGNTDTQISFSTVVPHRGVRLTDLNAKEGE